MVPRHRGDVREGDAPALFDVAPAAEMVVRMRVRVSREPQVGRPGVLLEIILEDARIALVADPIEVRRAFRISELAVIARAHPLPAARSDRGVAQDVMRARDDDLVAIRLDHLLPPVEGLTRDRAGGPS